MADVTITVDGKKITAPAGTLLIEVCKSAGIEIPAFCYYPGLSLAGRLPHVRRPPGKSSQAADRMHHADRRGAGLLHRHAGDDAGAQGHAATAAGQPSAGLPGVRRGRRVRAAGHDLQVRRGGQLLRRAEEPSRGAAVVARGVLRPAALHSVLPLRARLRRGDGRLRAGGGEPRLVVDHCAQCAGAAHAGQSRAPGLRAVRHVHRHLPGWRAHQRDLQI